MNDPYVASKSLYHTDRLDKLKKGKVFSPTMIQVDPIAYCNDNCNFCSYREENMYNNSMLDLIDAKKSDVKDHFGGVGKPTEKGTWPLWLADSLPIQMVDAGIPAIEITGGGEPTLWRGFDKLVNNLISYKREIGLVTNGSQINDERAKMLADAVWVRFSMDSATPETHQKIHRTPNQDFNRRIENIRRLVAYKLNKKTECTIGISYLLSPTNFDEVEAAAKLYRDIGVNNLRITLMYDQVGNAGFDKEYSSIELINKHLEQVKSKYETDSFKFLFDSSRLWTYSKPNNDFSKCYLQYFVWAIGADCKVYPCCIMKYHPEHAYADIQNQTLSSIVNDMNFQAKQNNLDVTRCFPCWLRLRNISIAQTQEKPMHENFL